MEWLWTYLSGCALMIVAMGREDGRDPDKMVERFKEAWSWAVILLWPVVFFFTAFHTIGGYIPKRAEPPKE